MRLLAVALLTLLPAVAGAVGVHSAPKYAFRRLVA